jgi:hypothetical protein
MMTVPKIISKTLLSAEDIQKLFKEEAKDIIVNINFWQYVDVLLKLNQSDAFGIDIKRTLRELYRSNLPYTSGELADRLGEKDAVVVHGKLGNFAKNLVDQLIKDFPKSNFPKLQAELSKLNALDATDNKWYSLVICDFIRHRDNGYAAIYYCLKSHFRAALAWCSFKNDDIRSWLEV